MKMQSQIVKPAFLCCALVIVLASVSSAAGPMSIRMTAATASDPSGVEYYFEETSGNSGGSDSSWQLSPFYRDTDLSPDTQYTYRSRARDKSPNLNETAWSDPESVTTGNPMDKLADFILHWLELGCEDPNWCEGADRTGDGFVGAEDFAIFATANWLKFCLKGYWRFNDSPFDGSAFDSSGYIREGSLAGDPNFVPDPERGQVLSLDGDGDYMQITGYKGITGIQPRTVCAWINTPAAGDIVSWGDTAGQIWSFYIDVSGHLRVNTWGGGNLIGAEDLRGTGWRHVAVTYEPQTQSAVLYVDGSEHASGTLQVDTDSDMDVKIGVLSEVNHRYFNGRIDNVHIYNRALDKGEIAALAGN